MIYPWHSTQWRQLAEHWQNRPHAWLFSGKENTGKTAFARHLAQALLCETPAGTHHPCGSCASCHLFAHSSHPDFYELKPEQPADGESAGRKLLQIKIDAVRDVISQIQLTSVRGGLRVVLVYPAENMNLQAANGLLKILEEPPADAVFLLVSHNRDKLLPTIKSRCRQMVLNPPDYAQALAYLKEHYAGAAETLLAFHSGAPLFEPDEDQDLMREELCLLLSEPRLIAILDYAAAFDKKKWPLAVFTDWLQKWLLDLGLAQQQIEPLYFPGHAAALRSIAETTNPATLFGLADSVNRISPYGHHTLSVKMQLECLLTEYLAFRQNK